MASISTDQQGNRKLQYVDPLDGKRKTIYLGKTTTTAADKFKRNLEALLLYRRENEPNDASVIRWIASLCDDHACKLAALGLIEPRHEKAAAPTVGEYVETFVSGKTTAKASTKGTVRFTLNAAVVALGTNRLLNAVDERAAVAMVHGMTSAGYAKAYVSKAVSLMRSMFKVAVREKLVSANPFEFVKAGTQVNNGRRLFIDGETVCKLIDTLPGTEWPLLVALARWSGLRVPSEPFALRWDHVLWDQGRMIVPTPKLEHIPGRETRTIPIFPEVRPYLDAAWEAAEEGTIYVFPKLRKLTGMSTLLRKRIVAAGLSPWPRTWQNLRASRATELADRFPSHVAAQWLGHTNEIADKHYRSVLDSHFQEALKTTQNPTQYRAEMGGMERTGVSPKIAESLGKQGFSGVSAESLTYPARIRT